MAKYSKWIVERICNLIRSDSYTIQEVCNAVNISRRTFYNWMDSKPNFKEAVEDAEKDFKELLIVEAKRSLMKLVKGFTVEEKRVITFNSNKLDDNGEPVKQIKEITVTEKHFQPNTAAVIFTLTNGDPANWKNRQSNEVAGTVSIKSDLEKLSDAELLSIINDGMEHSG